MSRGMRTVELDDDPWAEEDYPDPPPYSATTVAHDDIPEDNSIGFRREYLFSADGVLKVIQIVLSLIGFLALMAGSWGGSGFVGWTTMSAFITTTIIFCMVGFNIYTRVPGTWYVYMLVYCGLYTLKYFISIIICGIGAALSPSVIMACAICVAAFFAYLIDCIMVYKKLKAMRAEEARKRASGDGRANLRTDTGNSFCIIF